MAGNVVRGTRTMAWEYFEPSTINLEQSTINPERIRIRIICSFAVKEKSTGP
jgi:hypothetical protein